MISITRRPGYIKQNPEKPPTLFSPHRPCGNHASYPELDPHKALKAIVRVG